MKSQITIKKIQDFLIKGVQTTHVDDDSSRRMWWASLEVIQKDFLSKNYKHGGIWVASPLPALNDKKLELSKKATLALRYLSLVRGKEDIIQKDKDNLRDYLSHKEWKFDI